MSLILNDRVRETTAVTGTGSATLLGAVTGYQSFSVIGNGNTTYYTIADQGGPNWEVGLGTYSTTGPTLARTTVLASSNGGALVNFTTGTKDVFLTQPSEKAVYEAADNSVTLPAQLNLTNASNYNLYASGAGTNYMLGSLGIGSTSLSGVTLRLSKNVTGAAFGYPVYVDGQIQSDVTSYATLQSSPTTVASSFTLSNLRHFYANPGTFGASSVVTNQIGFNAESTLTGATNNYGFYGNLPAATGAWNLYMNGTANNYMAASLGIGSTSLSGVTLRLSKNVTGAAFGYPVYVDGQIQSDVTSYATLQSSPTTVASSFTLSNLRHFYANPGTFGASSVVTNQIGFNAENSITGATNNYGFYGAIAAASGAYNLYMAGTANNYLAGALGIGATAPAGQNLTISKALTGSVNGYSIQNFYTAQSDVTSNLIGFSSAANTAAASFTLTAIQHFQANQGTIGSGSTVTNQYGFLANSTLTGATNNYGFYGAIAAASGAYNLYMAGTANNYLAGALGIGATSAAGQTLYLAKTLTGATTAYGITQNGVVQSDVTANAYGIRNASSTAAAAFTLTGYAHFQALQGTIGSGSAISNQFGFIVDSSVSGATNNYAFTGNIAAATGAYNLYMGGTATNYFAGSLTIGSTTQPTVNNALVVAGLTATASAAPTIASATTIAPTTSIVFISGTTAIATITAPNPISTGGGEITLIPTGAFTTTTAGNIALASTAVVKKALIMTYDATTAKWYPSY